MFKNTLLLPLQIGMYEASS